jgi:hypothetical protein
MNAASDYTKDAIINATLRGQALDLPSETWIALHTGDPGGTGDNEVTNDQWPAYVRRHAEQGGPIGSGWTPSTGGQGSARNTNQLTYPSYDGVGDLTITHWTIFYESQDGTVRYQAPLQTPRLLKTGDVFVFDANALAVTMAQAAE